MIRVGRAARACVMLLGILALAGCRAATGKTVAPELAGNDPSAQLEFWHSLTEDKVTSNDQAFHGLLLFFDGKDDAADYAGRVAALKERKMLPGHFNEPAERSVSRGNVAVAIVKFLKIRGGLTMMITDPIFGVIPRYAVRELMFMNLYPPGSAQQTFTGAEFVGIIGRVEDYQRAEPGVIPGQIVPDAQKQPISR